MCEEGDADEPHGNRPQIREERAQLGARDLGAAAQRLAHQRDRERGSRDCADESCGDRAAEAIAGGCESGKEHEPDEQWKNVGRRERVEPLQTLQDAERDRKHERGDQRALGEDDDADGMDVEQVREWCRERERHEHERSGRGKPDPERCTRERGRAALVAGCDAARDLARDGHLQGGGRNQHDGEEPEQCGQ